MSPRKYIKKIKKRRPRDPFQYDRAVGLRYTTDALPGIKRAGACYAAPDGEIIGDWRVMARIRAIGIPKDWKIVWISPYGNGHLQATGYGPNRRRATIFHPRWIEVSRANKFERLKLFAATLPAIRERIVHDLDTAGLPRSKALAAVVRLLDLTSQSAEPVRHYGSEHLGDVARLLFRGRKILFQSRNLYEARMAKAVTRLSDLPGQQLFEFIDHQGTRQTVTSNDIHDYIRDISGGDFGIRDLRSWSATVLTYARLLKLAPFTSDEQAARNVRQTVEAVAKQLAHSPVIARRGHIHPAVIDHYLHGVLFSPTDFAPSDNPYALRPEEQAILAMIEHKIEPKPDPPPEPVPELEAVAQPDPASNPAGEPHAPEQS